MIVGSVSVPRYRSPLLAARGSSGPPLMPAPALGRSDAYCSFPAPSPWRGSASDAVAGQKHLRRTAPRASPSPAALDALSNEARAQVARTWGLKQLAAPPPARLMPSAIAATLPEELYTSGGGGAPTWLAPAAALAAGLSLLLLAGAVASSSPTLALPSLVLRPPSWLLIGTGYAGLFQLADHAARASVLTAASLPSSAVASGSGDAAQSASVGSPEPQLLPALLMAPSLFSYAAWRVKVCLQGPDALNVIGGSGGDPVASAVTVTRSEMARTAALLRTLRLGLGLLPTLVAAQRMGSSLRLWLDTTFGADLRAAPSALRAELLAGWLPPLAFAGLVLPFVAAAWGGGALLDVWLAPWLVFHGWRGALMLAQHGTPNIAKAYAAAESTAAVSFMPDAGQAAIAGSVNVVLPRVLDALLGRPGYATVRCLAPGVPARQQAAAHAWLKARMPRHVSEAELSPGLLGKLCGEWALYDEQAHVHMSVPEALAAAAGPAVSQQQATRASASGSNGKAGPGSGGKAAATAVAAPGRGTWRPA